MKLLRNTKSPIAETAVRHIAALYAIEAELRGKPPEMRLAARQNRSAPIVSALKPWFEKQLSLISSGSTLAGDIRYALGHWSGLTRFLEDVTAGNLLFDDWSDAIEDNGCGRMRRFIEMMLEEKLDAALLRPRFGRRTPSDGDGEPPDIANGR